jgi:hypothetical protein
MTKKNLKKPGHPEIIYHSRKSLIVKNQNFISDKVRKSGKYQLLQILVRVISKKSPDAESTGALV